MRNTTISSWTLEQGGNNWLTWENTQQRIPVEEDNIQKWVAEISLPNFCSAMLHRSVMLSFYPAVLSFFIYSGLSVLVKLRYVFISLILSLCSSTILSLFLCVVCMFLYGDTHMWIVLICMFIVCFTSCLCVSCFLLSLCFCILCLSFLCCVVFMFPWYIDMHTWVLIDADFVLQWNALSTICIIFFL